MFSGEGECVPFSNSLYPTGNVEDWLLEVENTMRGSLREILNRALTVYSEVTPIYMYIPVGDLLEHSCASESFNSRAIHSGQSGTIMTSHEI